MSSEVQIRQKLTIRKQNLNYDPPQSQVTFDLDGMFGPYPGALIISYDGTSIDLSPFADPAWIDVQNIEPNDGTGVTVSLGVYDPQTHRYYPVFKIRPGARHLGELDELIQSEFNPVTGTGTGIGGNRLMLKAKDGDAANVFVGVFER